MQLTAFIVKQDVAQGLWYSYGKFCLPPMKEFFNELNYLFYSDPAMSKQFLAKLRQYNSAFQIMSFFYQNYG